MSSNEPFGELSPELKSLEAALAALQPTEGRLDRDRLMYLSGRASVQRRPAIVRFAWPLASAALVLVSLTLGGRLLYLQGRGDRIVYIDRESGPGIAMVAQQQVGDPRPIQAMHQQSALNDELNYLQLRRVVLVHGADSLPPAQAGEYSNGRHGAASRGAELPKWPLLTPENYGG